jgi:hypothetical protein
MTGRALEANARLQVTPQKEFDTDKEMEGPRVHYILAVYTGAAWTKVALTPVMHAPTLSM